jgi:hypothetical protein
MNFQEGFKMKIANIKIKIVNKENLVFFKDSIFVNNTSYPKWGGLFIEYQNYISSTNDERFSLEKVFLLEIKVARKEMLLMQKIISVFIKLIWVYLIVFFIEIKCILKIK